MPSMGQLCEAYLNILFAMASLIFYANMMHAYAVLWYGKCSFVTTLSRLHVQPRMRYRTSAGTMGRLEARAVY
jgi:hypothetical protein